MFEHGDRRTIMFVVMCDSSLLILSVSTSHISLKVRVEQ